MDLSRVYGMVVSILTSDVFIDVSLYFVAAIVVMLVFRQAGLTMRLVQGMAVFCHPIAKACYIVMTWGFSQRERSLMLEKCATRLNNLREILVPHVGVIDIPFVSQLHSHPKAAAYRTGVNFYLDDIIKKAGYEPYHVSAAQRDDKGSRYFWMPKDLTHPYRHDDMNDNTAIVFTDVDYYVDINEYLHMFKPILMYTFYPTKMTGRTEDYSYRMVDGEVEFQVRGGAKYRHQLWDYCGDVVTIIHPKTKELLVFNIEQRVIEKDSEHRFIALTPSAKFSYPFYSFMDVKNGLERRVIDGQLYDPVTDRMSVADNGSYQSVELAGRTYTAIKERIKAKTSPAVIADLERLLIHDGHKNAPSDAAILYGLMELMVKGNVVATGTFPTSFHPTTDLVTDDPKSMGEAAATPLAEAPALFPTKSKASEKSAIMGRVTKVRNKKIPPPEYKIYANEFVTKLVKIAGKGAPISCSDVNTRQDKARQRATYAADSHLFGYDFPNKLAMFVKTEAYGQAGNPRVITSMDTNERVMLSTFVLPFVDEVLKKQGFYTPGMTPTGVVLKLAEITKDGCIGTDFNRFDGTISAWLQEFIVLAAMMRWCNPKDRAALKKLFKEVFKRHARTKEGVVYDPLWGTRSGAPITSSGNTKINAFVSYCALRKLGFTHEQAWNHLQNNAAFCGDDGQNMFIEGLPEMMEQVCETLGLSLKAEVTMEAPYAYCGRYFVDPARIPDSFQDPMRTLPKLHVVRNGPMTLEQRLTNKAAGYVTTDKLTPLIGTWATRVMEITGLKPKELSGEEQFKCSNAWPQHEENREELIAAVAKVMNYTVDELLQLDMQVGQVQSLDSFPIVLGNSYKHKICAVVGDVVEGTEQHSFIADSELIPNESKRQVGECSRSTPSLASKSVGSNGTVRDRPIQQGSRVPKETGGGCRNMLCHFCRQLPCKAGCVRKGFPKRKPSPSTSPQK